MNGKVHELKEKIEKSTKIRLDAGSANSLMKTHCNTKDLDAIMEALVSSGVKGY